MTKPTPFPPGFLVGPDSILGYWPKMDSWIPLYPVKKGTLTTQAIVMCSRCHGTIRFNGGPLLGSLCVPCFNKTQIVDP